MAVTISFHFISARFASSPFGKQINQLDNLLVGQRHIIATTHGKFQGPKILYNAGHYFFEDINIATAKRTVCEVCKDLFVLLLDSCRVREWVDSIVSTCWRNVIIWVERMSLEPFRNDGRVVKDGEQDFRIGERSLGV